MLAYAGWSHDYPQTFIISIWLFRRDEANGFVPGSVPPTGLFRIHWIKSFDWRERLTREYSRIWRPL
jgi:hypothetical protein